MLPESDGHFPPEFSMVVKTQTSVFKTENP